MRFEYDRLTGEHLSQALRDIGLSPGTFARFFGLKDQVVFRWLKDEQDIARWVQPVLELLRLPGAIRVCRETAALTISLDRDHPERGAYPYQQGRTWPDDKEV